jgi:TonB-dependent starch-binding outer membrane protein SusC
MSLDNRAAPNDGAGGARPQRRGTKVLPSRGRKLGLLVPGSLILAGLLLFPPSATEAAAQQGTISGEVVERGTLRALRAAQVMVPDLGLGALTGANGQYSIENVPAGTHEVRVQALGFETMTQEVTVAAGQVATLDFQLGTRAVALDELVVTGVGVVQERRQLGQTIASIGSADIEEAVSTNLMELLQGRVSGMTATPMGEVGQSAPIVLRGIVSLSQRNSPVIYIDGIRMDNNPTSGPSQRGGSRVSRLNDINPEDIESIEILKGPAASALYGTAAANGVIQITTRRGIAGATQWNAYTEYGQINDVTSYPANWQAIGIDTDDGELRNCRTFQQAGGRNVVEGGQYELAGAGFNGLECPLDDN